MANTLPTFPEIFRNLKTNKFLAPIFISVTIFLASILGIVVIITNNNNQESVATPVVLPNISFVNSKGASQKLYVEIADTPALQERGLMSRTSLGADKGMLFVFDSAAPRTFWMKDTLIPLDIVFLDNSMRVVNMYKNTLPNQTSELYPSQVPVLYALETNGGWSDTTGLRIGDQLILK